MQQDYIFTTAYVRCAFLARHLDGAECRRAVGLFLPDGKEKNKIKPQTAAAAVLATGNFLLEETTGVSVRLSDKSVACKNSNGRAKKKKKPLTPTP